MIAREEKQVTLDEKTRVQLFAVLASIPVFVGAVAWITGIYLKAEASETRLEKQEQKIEAQYLLLQDIRDRVIRIEEHQNVKQSSRGN